ncbi:MAG: LPS export ABC transporter periplasmic protein LptC [Alphaproteobacteria bacterium]|nr:LPS export ABC transporter periplasmic protein LptC [Alphaproteobacteria bacterium]
MADAPQTPDLDHFLGRKRKTRAPLRFINIRTKWMRRIRILIPVLGLIVLAVLFLVPQFHNDRFEFLPQMKTAPAEKQKDTAIDAAQTENELANPRFESRDEDNQPYTVTAERAFQKRGDLDNIFLEKPVADITLKTGDWLALKSQTGTYRQNEQKIDLHDNVKIFYDKGYTFDLESMQIDIKNQHAASPDPVTGQGPLGTLEANGMVLDAKSKTITFQGPAKMIFDTDNKNETN